MRLDFWNADFWSGVSDKSTERKLEASRGRAGLYYYDSYTGEKNLGEVGPVKDLRPDYQILNMRSWQLYLESDISQTILNKYVSWIVDTGLKANSTPEVKVLRAAGINIDQQFNEDVESLFNLWLRSKFGAYNQMDSINSLAQQAYKTAKIGGDCLVVLRYVKGRGVTVELIDGAKVQTPPTKVDQQINGKIVDGVEVDETGRHIQYWVRSGKSYNMDYVPIPAWSAETGMRVAFLVKGNKYRINSRRGLPVVATVVEAISKLDRYKEAAVGSAEERAKIVYQVVHSLGSDGENPFLQQMVAAFDADSSAYDDGKLPQTADGQQLANDFYASTNRQLWNLPVGSEMKAINSQNELFFKDFFGTNADIICGAIGIPPNVAFSVYNDSFSASRAATKDWDHTISVERAYFQEQFYQPLYDFWLHVQILEGKIQAPGYMTAYVKGDLLTLEAYRVARFTGPLFPHIDPVKEVKAARLRLGSKADHIPLSTVEHEAELLGGGDSQDTIEQFARELDQAEELGITPDNMSQEGDGDGDPPPEDD